jgi:hypothetical protein
VLSHGLTELGEEAFSHCESLKSITIPESVRDIKRGIFNYCSSLESFSGGLATEEGQALIIDGRLVAVVNKGLSEYSVPEGVTEIGSEVFFERGSLKKIRLPESLTVIRDCAFWGCSEIKSISIPKGVTKIERLAFLSCTSLEKISICEGITEIGDRAFEDCKSLREIYLPDSLTTIGCNILNRCESLERIEVGPKLFANKKYLKETFPVQLYKLIDIKHI